MSIRRSAYVTGAGGSGGLPSYTVATFGELPATATAGQRCTVTGETGLSGVVCVNVSANVWSLESVTCAWLAVPALGATSDLWYSSGGITVTTATGATLTDSTHNRSLRWWPAASLGCDGVWLMQDVYASATKTLYFWASGTEDNATLNTLLLAQGWGTSPNAATLTASNGTATLTSDGTKISLTTTCPGTGSTASATHTNTLAAITSARNAYFSALVQVPTLTGTECDVRFALLDGTDAYDLVVSRVAGVLSQDGRYVDIATNYTAAYADQTAGASDMRTAEVLLEMRKRGTFCQFRLNGGIWRSLSGATARNSAGIAFQIVARSLVNGATAATVTYRCAYLVVDY